MGIFNRYSDILGKEEKPVDKKEAKVDAVVKKPEQIVKKQEPAKQQGSSKKAKMPFNPLLSLLKLGTMIKKDLKLLIRSKTSALVVLLGPLAIILLVGLAFNSSSLYNLRIASYSEGYSSLTDSIIESLKDQQYSVIKSSS